MTAQKGFFQIIHIKAQLRGKDIDVNLQIEVDAENVDAKAREILASIVGAENVDKLGGFVVQLAYVV